MTIKNQSILNDVYRRGKVRISSLHQNIEIRNVAEIKRILNDKDAEENINKIDFQNKTPLHYAVYSKSPEIIDILISKNANLDAKDENDRTPLHHAVASGNNEMVEKLLKAGAKLDEKDKEGKTALDYAEKLNKKVITQTLEAYQNVHQAANNPNSEYLIDVIQKIDQDDLTTAVNAKDKAGETPLHYAVMLGKKKNVEILIKAGANPDIQSNRGKTALDDAKTLDRTEIIPILEPHPEQTQTSSDIVSTNPSEEATQAAKQTDFDDAIEMVKKFFITKHPAHNLLATVKSNKNINSQDKSGKTLLNYALLSENNDGIIEKLLKAKADPNIPDNDGIPPLHHAILFNNKGLFDILLEYKADLNIKSRGMTPLHRAITAAASENTVAMDMVARLEANDADLNEEYNKKTAQDLKTELLDDEQIKNIEKLVKEYTVKK